MSKSKQKGYLPKDYVPPVNSFMKLMEGDNEIRILSKPIIGKVWWETEDGEVRKKGEKAKKGDKPRRVSYKDQVPEDARDSAKEFWTLKVLDYNTTSVRVLEITQASIISSLTQLINNEKWGDPRNYDINIKREGEGLQTAYYVIPSPPDELPDDMQLIVNASTISLEDFVEKSMDSVEEDDEEIDEEDLPF